MRTLSVIKAMGDRGLRVFRIDTFREITDSLSIKGSNVPQLLHSLLKNDVITHLYKGLYSMGSSFLSGPPLNEYEIASYIVSPYAVCCWGAFSAHGLTDQLPDRIDIMTTSDAHRSSRSAYRIGYTTYKIITVRAESFFGFEKKFITEVPVIFTDLERTLLDGLVYPGACGGFAETVEAFRLARTRLDPAKLLTYGKRMGVSVLKRCGWVLETVGYGEKSIIGELQSIPSVSSYKLDVTRPNQGKWNNRWRLRENIYA